MTNIEKRKSLILWSMLVFGAVAFVFSGGRWNVPVTAWIWPFCFLCFLKKSDFRLRYLLAWLLMCAVMFVKSKGYAADAGVGVDIAVAVALGTISFLPFLADKFLSPGFSGILRTLILPMTVVAVDFYLSLSPFSVLGSVASTQTGVDELRQLASLVGANGITFIVMCFASILYEAVDGIRFVGESLVTFEKKQRHIMVYALVLVSIFVFGGIRLAFAPVDTPVMKVAMSSGIDAADDKGDYHMLPLKDNIESVRRLSDLAAGAGAELLVFNEEAYAVESADEDAFIKAAGEVAKQSGINLIIGLEVDDTYIDPDAYILNKAIFLDKNGELGWVYQKQRLIPILEDEYLAGNAPPPSGTIITSAGEEVKYTCVICMDGDFPQYVRDIIPEDTDVLFIPTWDWSSIRAYHSNWVEYRAVENGVSLLRSAMGGTTAAVDPYARELMRSDFAQTGSEYVVFAEVPIRGVKTLYAALGRITDVMYGLSIVFLLILAVIRIKNAKRLRNKAPEAPKTPSE